MIKKITIQQFKSVLNAELDFGRVNMFIGSNGAGKSNVLEAIGVASASVGRGVSDLDLQQKGVRLTPPALMTSAFAPVDDEETNFFSLSIVMSDDVDYRVRLANSNDRRLLSIVSEVCKKEGQELFFRTRRSGKITNAAVEFHDLAPERGVWDSLRAISSENPAQDALDTLAQYAIYAPQVDFLRGQAGPLPPSVSVGLHGEGLPAAVDSLLQHRASIRDKPECDLQWDALQIVFLPGWADRIQVGALDESLVSRAVVGRGKDRPMLYFEDKYMEKSRKRLSVYDSSEGTLFLLFVATLLVHFESPRIFALDNVDNSLNPKMTRALIEKIIDITIKASMGNLDCGPRQVFLTSHNPTAIDAFDLFDDNQRVFVVRRNSEGVTEVSRLEPSDGMTREDWAAKFSGRNLSQLWIDGIIPSALGPDC